MTEAETLVQNIVTAQEDVITAGGDVIAAQERVITQQGNELEAARQLVAAYRTEITSVQNAARPVPPIRRRSPLPGEAGRRRLAGRIAAWAKGRSR